MDRETWNESHSRYQNESWDSINLWYVWGYGTGKFNVRTDPPSYFCDKIGIATYKRCEEAYEMGLQDGRGDKSIR